MLSEICDVAVIGGDMRQVYAADEWKKRGFRVRCFRLCDDTQGYFCGTLRDAVKGARTVIAPIPLTADRTYLKQKGGNAPISLEELLRELEEGQYFFAGCIPAGFLAAAKEKGIRAIDFMRQEEIAVYNTIATAEGAIAEAITKSTGNLHGSRCLILGYGRCARTLTELLRGMHCRVSVCARNPVQRMEASVFAEDVFDFSGLEKLLGAFDFIFNTVPALILDREKMRCMKPSVCLFDLASAPGGIDLEAAEEAGISAWMLPGLPGRYAPEASAAKLVEFVLDEYRRQGEYFSDRKGNCICH